MPILSANPCTKLDVILSVGVCLVGKTTLEQMHMGLVYCQELGDADGLRRLGDDARALSVEPEHKEWCERFLGCLEDESW